jgi:hypothetical protein
MEGWRLKLFCMPNKKERKETKNKITSEEIEIMSTQKQAILSPVPYMNIKDSNSTLNMEATRSSETFVYNKPTRCHIPEVYILQSPQLKPKIPHNINIVNLIYMFLGPASVIQWSEFWLQTQRSRFYSRRYQIF